MDDLTHLSARQTHVPSSPEEATLETFDNTHPDRDYVITFHIPEFTSLCPITGQPDFGKITLSYIADKKCVESKSLKLYIFSFRNHGAFHEECTNRILDDLVNICQPKWAKVTGEFMPRGGIAIEVEAEHGSRD
jgi:7-cyano-7-deazaguanine reductase